MLKTKFHLAERYYDISAYPKCIDVLIQISAKTKRNNFEKKDRALIRDTLRYLRRLEKVSDYKSAIVQEKIELFKKLAKQINTDAKKYFQKGLQAANYQETIANLNKAIDLNPFSLNYYWARGRVYQRIFEYKKAKQDYSKAIELDSNFRSAYEARGELNLELAINNNADKNLLQQALNDFEFVKKRGLKKGQKEYETTMNIALTYAFLKNHIEAKKHLSYLDNKYPSRANPFWLYGMGKVFGVQGDKHKQKSYFKKAAHQWFLQAKNRANIINEYYYPIKYKVAIFLSAKNIRKIINDLEQVKLKNPIVPKIILEYKKILKNRH